MTATQRLLAFLIKLEVATPQDYRVKIPIITEYFSIMLRPLKVPDDLGNKVEQFVEDLISWENGNQHASLEETIDEKYMIYTRPAFDALPDINVKTEAKIVQHPDKEYSRIHRETTHAGGVIEREMKQLQKKFPLHRFELSFEFQKLGKQKFYRIKIKTFKDE